MNNIELYRKAVDKWGEDAQINQAIEELNELAVALNHLRRDKTYENEEKLCEEIADVEIMLGQMKWMLELPVIVIDAIKRTKLERLEGLLNA